MNMIIMIVEWRSTVITKQSLHPGLVQSISILTSLGYVYIICSACRGGEGYAYIICSACIVNNINTFRP